MNDMNSGCSAKCWGAAALMGLFTIVMLVVAGQKSVLTAIILGGLAFALLGLLFNWLFCAPLPKPAPRETAVPGSAGGMGALVPDEVKPGAAAGEAQAARAEVAKQAEEAEAQSAEVEAEASADDSDIEPAETSDDGETAEAETPQASSDGEYKVKPSKALAGQAELSSRKGSWRYEGDGADESAEPDAAKAEPAEPEAAKSEPAEPAAETTEPAEPTDAKPSSEAPEGGSGLKPSKPLAGEADLASRKGSWKYEGGDAAATTGDTSEDFDKDGKLEGTGEGEKPAMMDAPREGGPDNLKEIKGIGPKLEKLCHSMGIYHFDQIAAWTDQEIAWVNANLTGFKGRVTRDDWVGQAKILMTGAETEFSQRVEDGKVY